MSHSVTEVPDLQLSQVTDLYIRRNFQNLLNSLRVSYPALQGIIDYLSQENIVAGLKHVELTVVNGASQKFVHGLGFTPQDILLTFYPTGATITFDYTATDNVNLVYSVSGITGSKVIRFLVGRLATYTAP